MTARNAIKIQQWFARETESLVKEQQLAQYQSHEDKVLELCRQYPKGIKKQHLYRRHRITKDAAEAKQLLEKLRGEGKLICNDFPTRRGGPTSRIYKLAQP